MKNVDFVRPKPTSGLRHIALNVTKLTKCVDFYTKLMGMDVEWQPDEDNYYLTSGNDNLALHRAAKDFKGHEEFQRLDHVGFIIPEKEQVDIWYDYLRAHEIKLAAVPKDHRDGARSFYCQDPEGNSVQIIYHPPLANTCKP